jgi:hypothetical protein
MASTTAGNVRVSPVVSPPMTMVLTGRELATNVCAGSSQALMVNIEQRMNMAKDSFRVSMMLP